MSGSNLPPGMGFDQQVAAGIEDDKLHPDVTGWATCPLCGERYEDKEWEMEVCPDCYHRWEAVKDNYNQKAVLDDLIFPLAEKIHKLESEIIELKKGGGTNGG